MFGSHCECTLPHKRSPRCQCSSPWHCMGASLLESHQGQGTILRPYENKYIDELACHSRWGWPCVLRKGSFNNFWGSSGTFLQSSKHGKGLGPYIDFTGDRKREIPLSVSPLNWIRCTHPLALLVIFVLVFIFEQIALAQMEKKSRAMNNNMERPL